MISNYRLLDADMYSYYPAPKFWCRLKYERKPWEKNWKTINGLGIRFWNVGMHFHFGPGVYHNGRKWIIFWYDWYQDYLENGGW